MNKILTLIILLLLSGCSKSHYVTVSEEVVKNINIPRNYKVIYCSCNENPVQLKIVTELKSLGLKMIEIDQFSNINNIDSKSSIVIYGYKNKVVGSPRNFMVTYLVNKSKTTDCGKRCDRTEEWNELVHKKVIVSGNAIHNSVLLYKIDTYTELLMAINSGDKYSISLQTKKDTGSKKNILSEKNAYKFN